MLLRSLARLPALALAIAISPTSGAAESNLSATKHRVENFRLLDHTGRSHELYRQTQAPIVVLFVAGNGCPIVRQSFPALRDLRHEHTNRQVIFWAINSNAQDDRASVAAEAKEFGIDFPILLDQSQAVGAALNLTRTAEALAIDTKTWEIFYRGPVDDRLGYGAQKSRAQNSWLADAIKAHLAGTAVPKSAGTVKGCAIHFAKPASRRGDKITYVTHVAPILQTHCVPCHSEGNIGPFAMKNYDKVKGWSAMIREVLLEQRMPPWHADPLHGSFANDRSLSLQEKQTLLTWIAEGQSRGTGKDPLAKPAEIPSDDWPLGKPDYVISMPKPLEIPATGVIPYRYVVVDSPVPEDTWLRAAVVKAGNRKVVHHCLVFLEYPKDGPHAQPDYKGGIDGYFTSYLPGTDDLRFPEGTAKFLPKGARFVFQLHYNATGKPEQDQSELALYLHQGNRPTELHTRAAFKRRLEIPPGAANYEVQGQFVFKNDATLFEMSPHMHYRGARAKYEAFYPDGRSEVLLSVPNYDFNWQTVYRLKEPKQIPAGTRLIFSGAFDNSPQNPANPDPSQLVRFGEQTFDEMFIGYFNYAEIPNRGTASATSIGEAAAIP